MKFPEFPYFDNNATTPLRKEVLDTLLEYQQIYYANPSSKSHPLGIICRTLYQQHLKKIAETLGVFEHELFFTSGASESINTAIKGIFFQYAFQEKNHIISCQTEHSAVLETLQYLHIYHGAEITLLEVDENGNIELDKLEESIHERTLMVCLMAANNETGILHPIEDIYKICQKKRVLFFSDTTQLFAKQETHSIYADIFCGSAHKFHACKGIGFLVIKNFGRKVFLHPLIHGGKQQEIRSGTLPLPLIAALSTALEWAYLDIKRYINHNRELRDYFETQLIQKCKAKIHGQKANRISNTSNIMISENYYDVFVRLMKKFCYSHGSACSDGTGKPSHVLKSMGLSDKEIKQSFRFSFSYLNKKEELDLFLNELVS